jgi:predicted RNA methylase
MPIVILSLVLVLGVIVFLSSSFFTTVFGGSPFVPTPKVAVKEVLKHANIKKGDKVYDIGAGDGRFVHFAEKLYGAKAVGIEMDPCVYLLAKFKQWFFGWKGKMIRANSKNYDLSDADVIICYMLPKFLKKFQEKFETELKKGTKIISYSFSVGTLTPTKTIPTQGKIKKILIYTI